MRTLLLAAAFCISLSSAFADDTKTLPRRIAATIDRHLEADWTARNIKPAPMADDTEFLRRAYLDVIGRIPRVAEVTEFLANKSPNKREKIVEQLLTMPAYSRHFAATTRQEWLPQASTDIRFFFNGQEFEEYLRIQYRKNKRLDAMVRELLTIELPEGLGRFEGGLNSRNRTPEERGVLAFYTANETRPENLAAAATRVFLGVKLECAQCHDHPFATYTKKQFWQTAAFFGEFSALPPIPPSFIGPLSPQAMVNQLTIPNTETTLMATYFDGTMPKWQEARTPRVELADWLTARENPYFAKNFANRLWARFLGIGLIDPIDEPGDANPPSHPELLDELADLLREAKFDIHVFVKGITASQAYQRSSRLSHPSQSDARRFAKMSMKGLSGAQIFDSFTTATGINNASVLFDQNGNDFRDRTLRGKFSKAFPTAGKATESQTSILQSLLMMNEKQIEVQTTVDQGETLTAIYDAPFLKSDEKIEAMFLAVLSRKPTDEEREKYSSYLDRGGPSGDKKKAISDVFWILLNSTEFLFNH
jgi:hypothetical protein